MNSITSTDFTFENQKTVYKGKVRDVYTIGDDLLVMVATDRLSAFDVILPKGIPYKGQILNQIASENLQLTKDIVPNWLLDTPDPNVSVGLCCEPLKVEMVIRGYLAGHAAREYKAGKRTLCGVPLPEGLVENAPLPSPIITPSTKADNGTHDEDISREDILKRGIVSAEDYALMERYTYALFKRGSELARKKGLILVDTKYEFGTADGTIYLMDEVHTPDSSRYFYKNTYRELFEAGKPQRQLSKEFVRQWLMDNGFQGKEGQKIPEMTDEVVRGISERYRELYEQITGEKFTVSDNEDIEQRIEKNVLNYLSK